MKPGRITDLIFEYIDGRRWRLRADFAWRFRDGLALLVPRGFVSDKHSVPRPFWSLVPPAEYGEAAIVHDWLYHKRGYVRAAMGTGVMQARWDRKKCDLRYLEMLEDLGAGWLRRRTMYRAVRVGGWWAWRNHGRR